MTLTLQLPEDLAQRLSPLPENDRHRFALAALRYFDPEDTLAIEEQDKSETIAAVREALAEVDAGLDIPFEEYLEKRRAFWKARGKTLE